MSVKGGFLCGAFNYELKGKALLSFASCGNIIYGTADDTPGHGLLQPGTVDLNADGHPEVHLGMQNAQRWLSLPQNAPTCQTQPDDMTELLHVVTQYRETINTT